MDDARQLRLVRFALWTLAGLAVVAAVLCGNAIAWKRQRHGARGIYGPLNIRYSEAAAPGLLGLFGEKAVGEVVVIFHTAAGASGSAERVTQLRRLFPEAKVIASSPGSELYEAYMRTKMSRPRPMPVVPY